MPQGILLSWGIRSLSYLQCYNQHSAVWGRFILQLQKTVSELEKTNEELKSTQKDLKNADKEILVRIPFLDLQ